MKKIKGEYIFSKEEEKEIVSSYLNGESSTYIAQKYNLTNHKIILKVIHKNGVETKMGSRSHRKYKLNEEYFDLIDTPNKAYILGLLYADGSVNYNKLTVSISLQEEDKQILEAIRILINSEKPLEYIDNSNKRDFGYNYKNQYRLNFYSKHMCDSLIKIGMVQNKSLVLEFPNIQRSLYPHFIRGYFDGDGSYCAQFTKEHKFQPLITITSTNEFCKRVREILIEELNIPGGNVYNASCNNGITKVLSLSGRKQVNTFLEWIYNESELRLNRKYEKYINTYDYLNKSLSD